MPEITKTNIYRAKEATARLNNTALPEITEIGFGGGGHDSENQPLPADSTQTALKNEIRRNPIMRVFQETGYSVSYHGRLGKDDATGFDISEIALFDAENTMVGVINISPVTKQANKLFDVIVKLAY